MYGIFSTVTLVVITYFFHLGKFVLCFLTILLLCLISIYIFNFLIHNMYIDITKIFAIKKNYSKYEKRHYMR